MHATRVVPFPPSPFLKNQIVKTENGNETSMQPEPHVSADPVVEGAGHGSGCGGHGQGMKKLHLGGEAETWRMENRGGGERKENTVQSSG